MPRSSREFLRAIRRANRIFPVPNLLVVGAHSCVSSSGRDRPGPTRLPLSRVPSSRKKLFPSPGSAMRCPASVIQLLTATALEFSHRSRVLHLQRGREATFERSRAKPAARHTFRPGNNSKLPLEGASSARVLCGDWRAAEPAITGSADKRFLQVADDCAAIPVILGRRKTASNILTSRPRVVWVFHHDPSLHFLLVDIASHAAAQTPSPKIRYCFFD